jgi:hypothetical protein
MGTVAFAGPRLRGKTDGMRSHRPPDQLVRRGPTLGRAPTRRPPCRAGRSSASGVPGRAGRDPILREVVSVVEGTGVGDRDRRDVRGLSSGALHIDAKWGHFGADHWVQGRPTEEGQGAALDLSVARRKPELFVSGECLAEGPRQTLQTMLHEAVHALAHVRGVKDTSRGGKYHNKREFVALAGELGLAWPHGQRPIR